MKVKSINNDLVMTNEEDMGKKTQQGKKKK